MYRVVLVDDEQLILDGLSRAFPWASMNCEVVGTAPDGVTGLELIRKEKPDILFTDIRMPNMDGLSMLAALLVERPGMQVTVLTAFRDFEYAQQAIRLGVCRYLLKPSHMDELIEAVREMTARLDAARGPAENAAEENSGAGDEAGAGEAGSYVVKVALAYMREHCAEHISLNDVAEHVYVSQWHLSKLINRHTNRSFFDLLAGMRVEEAKKLMRDPSLRIHDIAEQVGFSDVAHFSKTFKKTVGETPGEYRLKMK